MIKKDKQTEIYFKLDVFTTGRACSIGISNQIHKWNDQLLNCWINTLMHSNNVNQIWIYIM